MKKLLFIFTLLLCLAAQAMNEKTKKIIAEWNKETFRSCHAMSPYNENLCILASVINEKDILTLHEIKNNIVQKPKKIIKEYDIDTILFGGNCFNIHSILSFCISPDGKAIEVKLRNGTTEILELILETDDEQMTDVFKKLTLKNDTDMEDIP